MNRPKVAEKRDAACCWTRSLHGVWHARTGGRIVCVLRQHHQAFGGNPMSVLRLDQILASAAVAFILAAPISALGQQTEPSHAGLTDQPKAGDASSGQPLTPPPASAAQTAPPARTPEQQPTADPLASLDPADRAVAERVRDLVAMKPNRIFTDEKVQAAVEAFYQKRNLAPLWLDKGVENARSKAVIARLKNEI